MAFSDAGGDLRFKGNALPVAVGVVPADVLDKLLHGLALLEVRVWEHGLKEIVEERARDRYGIAYACDLDESGRG